MLPGSIVKKGKAHDEARIVVGRRSDGKNVEGRLRNIVSVIYQSESHWMTSAA